MTRFRTLHAGLFLPFANAGIGGDMLRTGRLTTRLREKAGHFVRSPPCLGARYGAGRGDFQRLAYV